MVIDMPYTCQALKLAKGKKKLKENIMSMAKNAQFYSFDTSKADEVFDLLLADGMIKLTENQVIPSKEELA